MGLIFSILALVGVIWIAVIAFQNGDTVWGIVSIFCGIAAIIYGIMHFDEAKIPLGLAFIGIIGRIVVRAAYGT